MREEGWNLAGSRRRYSFLSDIFRVGWLEYLNRNDIRILTYLIHKANWSTRLAYPGKQKIYRATFVYVRDIQRSICRLCLFGLFDEITTCISHGQEVRAYRLTESVPQPDKEKVKKLIREVYGLIRIPPKVCRYTGCELQVYGFKAKGIRGVVLETDTSLKITKDQCVNHTKQKPYNLDRPEQKDIYNPDIPKQVFEHYTITFETTITKDLIMGALNLLPGDYHNSIKDQIYSKGAKEKDLFDKAYSEYVREKAIPEHTFMPER